MAGFSIGTAVGEGFGLIRRRPLSVFVWGLLTILPAVAAAGVMLPMMESMMGSMIQVGSQGEAGPGEMPDAMMAQMMQLQAVMAPLNALRFVLGVVVYTAIVRAVVRPAESSVFSLRLSMDEVRVFVVSLALVIGAVVGMLLLGLLGAAAGAGLWQIAGPAKGLVIALLVIAGIVGALLLGGRLSLIVPATVRFRTFAFVEGWNLGKGRSWSMVGVMLLLFLIIIGIEIVIGGILMGVVFGVMGSGAVDIASLEAGANPFVNLDDMARANWPFLAVGVVVGAMLAGMLTAILTAPFASVVRQLSGSGDTPADH